MNSQKLANAKREAKRFLACVALVEERAMERQEPFFGSKETGALRRASMDLTRALADLRRPQ